MDTFPYDSWEEASAAAGGSGFFTFGVCATGILVALMVLVFVVAIVGWVRQEGKKLDEQAARLRSAGGAGTEV